MKWNNQIIEKDGKLYRMDPRYRPVMVEIAPTRRASGIHINRIGMKSNTNLNYLDHSRASLLPSFGAVYTK